MKIWLILVYMLMASGLCHARTRLGVNVNPGDLQRAGQWQAWAGQKVDFVGDNFFANTWAELEGRIPEAGVAWSLDQFASSSNPLHGQTYDKEFAIPMFPTQDRDGTPFSHIPDRLSRGASGAYDAHFAALAQTLVRRGFGDAYIRLGWEFNIPDPLPAGQDDGGWKIGGASKEKAGAFAAYWRRIHTAMMAVPGARFQWVWCVLVGVDDPATHDRITGHAWPGGAYVDYVSCDVYDSSNYVRYWRCHWQEAGKSHVSQLSENKMNAWTWDEIRHGKRRNLATGEVESHLPGLDTYAAFAKKQGKQLMLSEWGLSETDRNLVAYDQPGQDLSGGNDNAGFIQNIKDWCVAHDIHAAIYFEFQINRQYQAYGESSPNVTNHSLLPGFWNNPAFTKENPLYAASSAHPMSAAMYLRAFHGSAAPMPDAFLTAGRQTFVADFEDGKADAFTPTPATSWSVQKEAEGKYYRAELSGAPVRSVASAGLTQPFYTVCADIKFSAAGLYGGLMIAHGPDEGYAFEIEVDNAGQPRHARIKKGPAVAWAGSKAEGDFTCLRPYRLLSAYAPIAVEVSPALAAGKRLRCFVGSDLIADWTDTTAPLTGIQAGVSAEGAKGVVCIDNFRVVERLCTEDFNDGYANAFSSSPGGWEAKKLGYHINAPSSSQHALCGTAEWKNYTVHFKAAVTSEWHPIGITVLNDGRDKWYQLEIRAASGRNPSGFVCENTLQSITLREVGGSDPAAVVEWKPVTSRYMRLYHDFSVTVEELSNTSFSKKARIRVTFDGEPIIDHTGNTAVSTTGKTGPWAEAWGAGYIDDFMVIAN